jgi:hypothetical protein
MKLSYSDGRHQVPRLFVFPNCEAGGLGIFHKRTQPTRGLGQLSQKVKEGRKRFWVFAYIVATDLSKATM